MKVLLSGIGSEALLTEFDSAGVEYIRNIPPVGTVMSDGASIQLIKDISGVIPWGCVTTAICAYIAARLSRKVTVTSKNNEIISMQGYTPKEIEAILPSCKIITAIETKKPDEAS